MSKKTVKRCSRPQCMAVYSEDNSNKYCDCGALLQLAEMEFPDKNSDKPRKENVRPAIISKPLGYLYLIPEDEDEEETKFKLGRRTLIGRSSDMAAVDVDLSQFGGSISRKHALITCEKDGFYITNLSENHSVHVNNKVVVNGQKMKLTSEDGIILSKKVLLQFEEGE